MWRWGRRRITSVRLWGRGMSWNAHWTRKIVLFITSIFLNQCLEFSLMEVFHLVQNFIHHPNLIFPQQAYKKSFAWQWFQALAPWYPQSYHLEFEGMASPLHVLTVNDAQMTTVQKTGWKLVEKCAKLYFFKLCSDVTRLRSLLCSGLEQ